MSAFTIRRIQLYVFRAPTPVPVLTAFGVMPDRPALVVRIEDADGAHGWGEVWANFPNCGAEHRARVIETLIAPRLLGHEVSSPEATFAHLTRATHVMTVQSGEPGPFAQCLAGLDIALHDLAARREGVSVARRLSGRSRISVPAYASGINPDGAADTVATCRDAGFRAFKLKIGFGRERDLANIRDIVDGLRDGERFMVDANQAWNIETALDMVREFEDLPLTWLEEPLLADRPDTEWRTLSEASTVALAGGENLRGMDAFESAIDGEWFRYVQPDTGKWGGITECRKIVQRVDAAGLTYCPHFLGSGIGLVAAAHLLATSTGNGVLEVDSNENPLREGMAQPYPPLADGSFVLSEAPGLGVEPDLPAVRPYLVASADLH
jgi:D-galactarolactone cycloisomerase